MKQYIVAYDEENLQSATSVYDVENSLGDIFTATDNSNIHSFFKELYCQKSGQDSMEKSSLVMASAGDIDRLMERFPADKVVAELSATVFEAMDTYPDAVFFYSYE